MIVWISAQGQQQKELLHEPIWALICNRFDYLRHHEPLGNCWSTDILSCAQYISKLHQQRPSLRSTLWESECHWKALLYFFAEKGNIRLYTWFFNWEHYAIMNELCLHRWSRPKATSGEAAWIWQPALLLTANRLITIICPMSNFLLQRIHRKVTKPPPAASVNETPKRHQMLWLSGFPLTIINSRRLFETIHEGENRPPVRQQLRA